MFHILLPVSLKSLIIHVYKSSLHWASMSVEITYIGLFGSLRNVVSELFRSGQQLIRFLAPGFGDHREPEDKEGLTTV